MSFEELLLTIMKAINRDRTVSSPYHLIKGKKSGQTLQDIGYYQLYPFFSVMPQLDKAIYDRSVQKLVAKGLLNPNEKTIELTDRAIEIRMPATTLNGWKYRGKEMIFMKRLSLIVQTFSHVSQGMNRFDPVINAEDIQQWVKNYFRKVNFRDSHTIAAFKNELLESINSVSLSEDHKLILLQRLTGAGWSGLTWEQIATSRAVQVLDVQLQLIEMLHGWMAVIEKGEYPKLSGLMEGIIQQSSLTETAQRTEKLFQQGFSLEQIASLRQLKTSTIEDHFVELAMNDPRFDYTAFIDGNMFAKILAVSDQQQTKRLRDMKEKLPDASYFQIRLALAVKGDMQ